MFQLNLRNDWGFIKWVDEWGLVGEPGEIIGGLGILGRRSYKVIYYTNKNPVPKIYSYLELENKNNS